MDVDTPFRRRSRLLTNNFAVENLLGKANAPEFGNQNPGLNFLKPKVTAQKPFLGTVLCLGKGVMP